MNTAPPETSRNWALAAHIAGVFAGYALPFGGLLAPLVIWLMKKDEDAFVAHQALEALNFQLTLALGTLFGLSLLFTVILMPLGLLILLALAFVSLWFGIQGAIAASRGEWYEYPNWALRLVR